MKHAGTKLRSFVLQEKKAGHKKMQLQNWHELCYRKKSALKNKDGKENKKDIQLQNQKGAEQD